MLEATSRSSHFLVLHIHISTPCALSLDCSSPATLGLLHVSAAASIYLLISNLFVYLCQAT